MLHDEPADRFAGENARPARHHADGGPVVGSDESLTGQIASIGEVFREGETNENFSGGLLGGGKHQKVVSRKGAKFRRNAKGMRTRIRKRDV